MKVSYYKRGDQTNPYWPIILTISLLVLVNVILFYPFSHSGLRLLSAAILFYFLSGFLILLALFPKRESLDYLEAIILSAGLSFALSTFVIFLVHLLLGRMTPGQALLFFDILIVLSAIFSYAQIRVNEPGQFRTNFDNRFLIALILLVFLAVFLRFTSLGYAEFQGDEIQVVSGGIEAVAGQDEILFVQKKGPAQFLAAAAVALFTGGAAEFAMRSPFALAGILTVIVTVLIGRRLLNDQVGIVAGALLLIEGFASAHVRTVQYQYQVLLMIGLSAYCAFRFLDASDKRESGKFFGLAIFFWGMGVMSHYDAVFILPALLLAYIRKYGLGWPAESRWPIILGGLITILVLASFYVPFIMHPDFQSTFEMYSEKKVGMGPFNNLPDFVRIGIFYNSPYYMILMAALTAINWNATLKQILRPKGLAYILTGLCVIGFLVSLISPSTLTIGDKNYAILFFLPISLVFIFSGQIDKKLQIILVWFFAFFISKAFLERAPGLHYYGFSPAWALIAAMGLHHVLNRLDKLLKTDPSIKDAAKIKPYRTIVMVLLLLIYGILAYYHYILFVKNDPEYAVEFPNTKHPLYWTPQAQRPGMPFFGLPHKAGWKTLGYLYATGALQGDYETNGRLPRPTWYIQPIPKLQGTPRYFFFDEESNLISPIEKFSKEAIEHFHELVAEVNVKGKPRLLIYEDRQLITGPVTVQQYDVEDYEAKYDQLFDSELVSLMERYQRSAQQDFLALGNYLERVTDKSDGIAFSSPSQPIILNYHYTGKARYLRLYASGAITDTDVLAGSAWIYAIRYHDEDEAKLKPILEKLATYGKPLGTRNFGAVDVSLYQNNAPSSDVGENRYLSQMNLSTQVALTEYRLDKTGLEAGEALHLTLFWQALEPLQEDYTVFVHFVRPGEEKELRAQIDSQPAAGEKPTSSWIPGQVIEDHYALQLPQDIPAGEYQLEIGMYDQETMIRLPVSSPASSHQDDKITLYPDIIVE